jgi:glycine C-acetyltransferase
VEPNIVPALEPATPTGQPVTSSASRIPETVSAAPLNPLTYPIYDKVRAYNHTPDGLKSEGLYFYMRKLESSSDARIQVNGREMLMFGSNNYLGMTNHPRVKEAARKAIEKFGVGAGSVRLLGGTFGIHEELESRLAHFKGTEAAIAYSSGYVSNLATISTFLNKDTDIAIIDERVHASLVDGLRFAKVPFRVFSHNDMNDLEEKLVASAHANRIVIADGVYSMDGDLANLPEIYRLARKYQSLVMIDEAHATGVLGPRGRGTPEHFGLHGRIDIVLGTLSKGLGGVGGFAAGPKELINFLKHTARGFVFSAALPPAVCAGLIAAMDVIETEPEWLIRLRENTDLLRKGLQQLGFNTGDSRTPIIPVIVGEDLSAYQLTRALHLYGIYVSPVTYPAVKKGTARIRVSVMATHTPADILKALDAFEKAKGLLRLNPPAAA